MDGDVKCNDCINFVEHGDVRTCTLAMIDVRVMGMAKHVDVYAECDMYNGPEGQLSQSVVIEEKETAKRGRKHNAR